MVTRITLCVALLCLSVPALCLSHSTDPAIDALIGYQVSGEALPQDLTPAPGPRDTTPPTLSISHVANGDITIQVNSDEDLYTGWVAEKEIWSVGNFDYWWLNTRLAKGADNRIYAAVKLYEYSHPSSNFDMFVLANNGETLDAFSDWNGPGGNPLIINDPSPNIYIGKPVLDPEGVVDSDNITYVFSGSGSIVFTKIAADGTILISGQTIITGADAWTNEIRTALDTQGRIYIVWSKDMHDITYAYSDDGGDSWSEQISLCYNAGDQLNKPQICCDANDNVHVIWQHWTGSSNLLAYMKLLPDGTVSIDESFLTQTNNQVWSAHMDIDEENNLHVVWARSHQQATSSYYTKINGNLDGGGLPLSDDELSLIQEEPFLSNQLARHPKCVVDGYQNVHALFERGVYGCDEAKSVHHKKMSAAPLLRIECPDGSVILAVMTGSGTAWEATFTPPGMGTYMVRASGSDSSGNTGVGWYEFEYDAGSVAQNPQVPATARILGNYPNPFTPHTRIEYALGENSHVRIAIYNANGQMIRTLLDADVSSGEHGASWDGRDAQGDLVPSGTYFCRVVAGEHVVTRSLTLMR
jgi:hypothetical protein